MLLRKEQKKNGRSVLSGLSGRRTQCPGKAAVAARRTPQRFNTSSH
jgi:hypothetical protein